MRWSEPGGIAPGWAGLRRARGWLFRQLTSVPLAAAQLALLTGLTLAADRHMSVGLRAGLGLLLALVTASTLAILWKRRPYPPSRIGFLLAHLAPTLGLAGALRHRLTGGGQGLLWAGGLSLLAGCAWMFYLKPPLKRREAAGKGPAAAPAPLPEPRIGPSPFGLALGAGLLLAGFTFARAAAPARATLDAAIPFLVRLACASLTLGAGLGAAGLLPPAGALRRQCGRPGLDPAQGSLRWIRAGFLILGGALAAGPLLQGRLQPPWGLLAAWLAYAAALHVHHVKAWKGPRALLAGLAAWAVLLAAVRGQ